MTDPHPPLPPRPSGEPVPPGEQRAWALDALDSLAEARGERMRERGDSRFGTLYMGFVTVVLVVAMGSSVFSEALGGSLCTAAGCRGALDPAALHWLAPALVAVTLGGTGVIASFIGPVGLTPARSTWLGTTPSDRAAMLRDPLAGVALSGAIAGMLGGIAAGLALGSAAVGPPVPVAVGGAVLGALTGVGVVLVAAVAQASPRASSTFVALSWVTLCAGLVLVVLAVGPWTKPTLVVDAPVLLGLIGLAVTLAGAACLPAMPGVLRHFTTARLRRSGEALEAVTAGILMLEGTAITQLVETRSRSARGAHPSRSLRRRGEVVIVAAEIRRLRRSPRVFVTALLVLPVPLLGGALFGPLAAVVLLAFCGIVVATRAAAGLRLWTRSSGIARFYPFSDLRVRLAYLAVPSALAALWLAVAGASLGLTVPAWSVLVLGAAAAVVRSAPESHTGFAAANTSMTPMGAVPVGLMAVFLRGPDIAAPAVALLLFGLDLPALVVAIVLLGLVLTRDESATQ